jgi:hypothetical protein
VSTASNYISKINPEFPVAGKDNSSQGFRDNFKNIYQALNAIDTGVEDLKSSSVQKTQTNDFDNNVIKQAAFQDCSAILYDETNNVKTGNISIDFSNGHYQKYKVGAGSNTFTIQNWPGNGKFSSLILAITTASTNATYVNFVATNVFNLGTNELPSLIEQGRPKVFELWSDGDDTNLFVKEISARVENTDIMATNVTTTNIVTTNIRSTNVTATNVTTETIVLGPHTITTATNTGTTPSATVIRSVSTAGNFGLLPNQAKTRITSDPVLDYTGDTTASSFSVVSTKEIMLNSKFTFASVSPIYTVVGITTSTVTVSPPFTVGSFSLNEELTFTNPQFTDQPTLVTLTSTKPSSVVAAKSDLKGRIYADADEIFVSFGDYSPGSTNWVQAATIVGDNNFTGLNSFSANVTLDTGASLLINSTGAGSITTQGGVFIVRGLQVGGATFLSTTTVLNPFTVSSTATFNGPVVFAANSFKDPLNISAPTTFTSATTVNNTLNVSSTATFSSATIINNTLNVSATATFASIQGTTATIGSSNIGASDLSPTSDGTVSLGKSGARWSAVWATSGTIQTSDLRLKENIQDSSLGLDFINDLRPVSFKLKQNPGPTYWGLIAQEVQGAIQKHNVEFAGHVLGDPSDPESTQNLVYTEFIAPLIKSVQELSAENNKLKIEIDNIKKNLGLN